MLRMLDLFAGIGGFSYAGEKLVGGYETVAFCEYDEHAQKVLRKHWPDTEIIGDIRELADDADRFRGLVDIITGDTPASLSRLPGSDEAIKMTDTSGRKCLGLSKLSGPRWVIGENVAGHITMGLDTVLSDLEGAGYSSRCYVIPAVAACPAQTRQMFRCGPHRQRMTTRKCEDKARQSEPIVGRHSAAQCGCGRHRQQQSRRVVSGKSKQEKAGRDLRLRCQDVWPTPTANEDAAGTPNGKMQRQLGNHPDIRGDTPEECKRGS